MTRLPSIAVKVSATTTCRTIAFVPSFRVVAGKLSIRDTARATWFDKSAVYAPTTRDVNYRPLKQSNDPANPFNVESYFENLVLLSHTVPSAGLNVQFPSQSHLAPTVTPHCQSIL